MGAEESVEPCFLTSRGPCVHNHVLNCVLGHILTPDTVTKMAVLASSSLVIFLKYLYCYDFCYKLLFY